ncbi:MAG TPA: hypothetical protein PLE48_17245, partial [Thiobacillus sp.]|nr:hypothetical protein [Thiobacillus sp.]
MGRPELPEVQAEKHEGVERLVTKGFLRLCAASVIDISPDSSMARDIKIGRGNQCYAAVVDAVEEPLFSRIIDPKKR